MCVSDNGWQWRRACAECVLKERGVSVELVLAAAVGEFVGFQQKHRRVAKFQPAREKAQEQRASDRAGPPTKLP